MAVSHGEVLATTWHDGSGGRGCSHTRLVMHVRLALPPSLEAELGANAGTWSLSRARMTMYGTGRCFMGDAGRRAHWENVYATKGENEVSWFQQSPAPSLELIVQ